MDRKWCLLMCALISAECVSTDYKPSCPDITGTVGSPLTLMCTVRCAQNCMSYSYKFKKNNEELSLDGQPNRTEKIQDYAKTFTFIYKIKKTSKEDNGSFTFWVQLNIGFTFSKFTVTLSEMDDTPYHSTDHTAEGTEINAALKSERNVPMTGPVISIFAIVGICVFVLVFMYRKKYGTCSKTNHDQECGISMKSDDSLQTSLNMSLLEVPKEFSTR